MVALEVNKPTETNNLSLNMCQKCGAGALHTGSSPEPVCLLNELYSVDS